MKLLDKYNFSVKLLCLLMLFYVTITSAQPVLPQRAITVYASQKLNFGLFYDKSGYGGSISVDPQGTRTVTGGIAILPSYPGQPALFEIKLCQGRSITISYPLETTLTSTGGAEIIMKIGPTQKGGNGAIFATENNCNFITILRVGGKLIIPPNTNAGVFTGEFEIYFEQQ
jgi:hypothetical protein|tara:strand:+ start:152 stop:664 length:513 start_codon:yes stop_codon:yes gene_type:complete